MRTFVSTLAILGFAVAAQSARAAGPAVTPALIEKGKAAYTTNCATCHGDKLDGNGPAGAMMNPKPRNLITESFKLDNPKKPTAKPTADQVFKVVTNGLSGTTMIGYGHVPEADRWAIVHYVLSLRNKK